MPLYNVEHIIPLPVAQQDELAEAITIIHSTKFSTPRLFVNVVFHATNEARSYIAGKQRRTNRIIGNVRSSGNSRSQADFDELAKELAQAWADVVHPNSGNGSGAKEAANGEKEGKKGTEQKVDPQQELRAVIIVGGLISAYEAGFIVPPAGQDVEWAKSNMEAFKKKAAGGDEEFQELVEDLESRKEFGGDPAKAAKKKEEKEAKKDE